MTAVVKRSLLVPLPTFVKKKEIKGQPFCSTSIDKDG
jgi:hypothetical protein